MSSKVLFKASDGTLTDDPGREITLRARRLQAQNPQLSFARARDLVILAEPELAHGYLNGEKED